jgi:hypothetical protein
LPKKNKTQKNKIKKFSIVLIVIISLLGGIFYILYNNSSELYNHSKYDKYLVPMTTTPDYDPRNETIKLEDYYNSYNYTDDKKRDITFDIMGSILFFRNNNSLIYNHNYSLALGKAVVKDWESTMQILNMINTNGYNSYDEVLLKEYKYNLAEDKANNHKWREAIDILNTITDYKDSTQQIHQYKINLALDIIPVYPKSYKIPDNPTSQSEFEAVLIHMIKFNQASYTISYKNTDDTVYDKVYFDNNLYENLDKAHTKVFYTYPEYFSNMNTWDYSFRKNPDFKLTIKLSDEKFTNETSFYMFQSFREESYNIIDGLIAEGLLTKSMNQKDKALAIFKWVACNLEYDYDFDPLSFTGYGAVTNRKAVCHGYTALYNMLCRIVGIDVIGAAGIIEGELHSWTYATLDGEKAFIDASCGDSGNCYDMRYFIASEEFLRSIHRWDKDLYNTQ